MTDRSGTAFRLMWLAGLAALIGATAVGLLPSGWREQTALALGAPAALIGLAAVRWPGPRLRLAEQIAWIVLPAAAVVVGGGLTGPLAGWTALPLVAALAFSQGRGRLLGVGGALMTAGLGYAASVGWPIQAAPALAFFTTFLTLIWASYVLLSLLGVQEGRAAGADASARRLEQMLAALPLLSLRLTPEGGVRAAFGHPPGGLSGPALADLGLLACVGSADRAEVAAALAEAVRSGEAEARFSPEGEPERSLSLTARRLPDGDLVAVVRDISRQRAREAALVAARVEAETLHMGKSRFLASMSHELRTPLNAVLGFSDMMRQRMFGPMPERYLEYANLIHEAGGHLLDLINDVLDMSKIEAERFELSRERFDARDPASAALRLIRLQAYDKVIDLRSALPADPVWVEADKRAVKQIVLNLLSNAVKFTPRRGSVTISLEARGKVLEISVADTGVGLSAADIERVGRPYEQAGPAEQRARGTGLGLSLVRSMAELHGGELTIESTLGEGSVFTVRLPVVADTRPSATVVPFPAPPQPSVDQA